MMVTQMGMYSISVCSADEEGASRCRLRFERERRSRANCVIRWLHNILHERFNFLVIVLSCYFFMQDHVTNEELSAHLSSSKTSEVTLRIVVNAIYS